MKAASRNIDYVTAYYKRLRKEGGVRLSVEMSGPQVRALDASRKLGEARSTALRRLAGFTPGVSTP